MVEAQAPSQGETCMQDATLGQRLQSVRKRRGLTQAELAAETGLSVSLIRKLEQGTGDRILLVLG
jgi:transcriptional regulator with XRE-family HTH domain